MGPCSLLFKSGMKIEAKDPVEPNRTSVATIVDIRPGDVKVHFDGYGNEYDYWCPSWSTDIHPCMWSGKQLNVPVMPPPGHMGAFKWNEYLAKPENRPAPAHLFNKVGVNTIATFMSPMQYNGFVRECAFTNTFSMAKLSSFASQDGCHYHGYHHGEIYLSRPNACFYASGAI